MSKKKFKIGDICYDVHYVNYKLYYIIQCKCTKRAGFSSVLVRHLKLVCQKGFTRENIFKNNMKYLYDYRKLYTLDEAIKEATSKKVKEILLTYK